MKEPAAARLVGALVFSGLLAVLLLEGDARPNRGAEAVVAMIRDSVSR
ncbi:hypothetical protein ACFQ4O_03665 [Methylopila musalis]|uniref:Uncharacterized protein n=1 Tax=Methylopila musalis TaxID=1134781 RepID=A0ABW3Z4J0_9HYPH